MRSDRHGSIRPRAVAIGAVLAGVLVGDARADAPAGGSPSPTGGSPSPASGPALQQARAAWARRAFATAEPLYREAIEKGGLAPDEVLEGYVRLGAIRAVTNKKSASIAAFRAASVLDAGFTVPREAGRKGASYAARAKKDTSQIGGIQLAVEVPKQVRAGAPFTVTATLDAAHLPIVTRIGLWAKDGTTGKEVILEAPSEPSVAFEVGPEVALPGASIVVRVDALDKQQNRLASAEDRVRIPSAEPVATPVAVTKAPAAALAPTPRASEAPVRRGGGFWSSAWPYVIGGIAVVGAGTAVYFGTRPVETVSVGQIGIRTP